VFVLRATLRAVSKPGIIPLLTEGELRFPHLARVVDKEDVFDKDINRYQGRIVIGRWTQLFVVGGTVEYVGDDMIF